MLIDRSQQSITNQQLTISNFSRSVNGAQYNWPCGRSKRVAGCAERFTPTNGRRTVHRPLTLLQACCSGRTAGFRAPCKQVNARCAVRNARKSSDCAFSLVIGLEPVVANQQSAIDNQQFQNS